MFRFILSFFGGIFTTLTMSIGMVALTIGAIFWMYGRDLPSHESLAQYTPPTISRIYSGQGRLIDEFAKERRLFAPADTIPDLVKQAFTPTTAMTCAGSARPRLTRCARGAAMCAAPRPSPSR